MAPDTKLLLTCDKFRICEDMDVPMYVHVQVLIFTARAQRNIKLYKEAETGKLKVSNNLDRQLKRARSKHDNLALLGSIDVMHTWAWPRAKSCPISAIRLPPSALAAASLINAIRSTGSSAPLACHARDVRQGFKLLVLAASHGYPDEYSVNVPLL